jgi:hypothetical protein
MSNCFERYEIDHLSPSACNLFVASPAMYVMERVLKRKAPVGAAAHRGNAVEAGIAKGLFEDASLDECVSEARKTFAGLASLSGDPRKEKEIAAIPAMVKVGLQELKPYGKPSSAQGKIEWKVEGLHVPMIGFYDFEWADHGILVDLKTTHKLPSKISTNHARQVALYNAARGNNLDTRVCYTTPSKTAVYRLENSDEHVRALEKIARTIQNFLSISNDPLELASIVVPDVDSFYFADPLARKHAFEVFGI